MALPVAENLDLRVAGRGDKYDDVGGLKSWRLAVDYRPSDIITLRSSWSAGDRPPSMLDLYSSEVQDHPYVECDPGTGSPPRSCTELNPRQVTRVTVGNPALGPSDSERLAISAQARKGPLFLSVEGFRLSRSDMAGQNTADWVLQNLNACMNDDKAHCIERVGGDITIHDSYANIVEAEFSGITTRLGGGGSARAGELSVCAEPGGTSPAPNCASRAMRTGTPYPGIWSASRSWHDAAA